MAATLAFQKAVSTSGFDSSRSLPFTSIASAAGQDRLVALVSICSDVAAAVTYSNVQIDGQAATQIGPYSRVTDAVGNGPVVSFWRAPGTASTSINVTFGIASGTVFDARGALWNLNDAGTLYDFTTASGASDIATGGVIDLNLNVDTIANGCAAAAFIAYNSTSHSTVSWSGLTERYNGGPPGDSLYGRDWFGAADRNITSGSTPLTVIADLPNDFEHGSAAAGLAVSFNPASTGITGTLAATEGPDVAAFAAVVRWLATLAATEAPDIAAFAATAATGAVLAATEAPDTAAFVALPGIPGTIAATEAPDTAAFAGVIINTGYLAATEAPDTCRMRVFVGRVSSGEARPRFPSGTADPRSPSGVALPRTL